MSHTTNRQDCHVEPIEKRVDRDLLERGQRVSLAVSGMGCVNCANRVRNSLLSTAGVLLAEVALEAGRVDVVFDAEAVRIPELQAAVSRAGEATRHVYRAVPVV